MVELVPPARATLYLEANMHVVLQPKRRPSLGLFVAVTAMAACDRVTAPDPTSEPGAAALNVATGGVGGSDMVPFAIRATFGVTADSTHLGKTSVSLLFDTCTLALPLGGVVAFTAEGRITLTAANGDQLYGIGAMTQFANGDFVLNSATTIGGTGRFANATGTSSGSGWIDRLSLQGYFEFKGPITRPNA